MQTLQKVNNYEFFIKTEEIITEGENGISIDFLHAQNKDITKKVSITKNGDGAFEACTKINNNENKKKISKNELVEMIETDNDIKFIEKDRKPLKFLFEEVKTEIVNGFCVTTERIIVEGEKGIIIKYFYAFSKNKQKKVYIKGNTDGTFKVYTKIDGKEDKKKISKNELVEMIETDNDLKFIERFINTPNKKQKEIQERFQKTLDWLFR